MDVLGRGERDGTWHMTSADVAPRGELLSSGWGLRPPLHGPTPRGSQAVLQAKIVPTLQGRSEEQETPIVARMSVVANRHEGAVAARPGGSGRAEACARRRRSRRDRPGSALDGPDGSVVVFLIWYSDRPVARCAPGGRCASGCRRSCACRTNPFPTSPCWASAPTGAAATSPPSGHWCSPRAPGRFDTGRREMRHQPAWAACPTGWRGHWRRRALARVRTTSRGPTSGRCPATCRTTGLGLGARLARRAWPARLGPAPTTRWRQQDPAYVATVRTASRWPRFRDARTLSAWASSSSSS